MLVITIFVASFLFSSYRNIRLPILVSTYLCTISIWVTIFNFKTREYCAIKEFGINIDETYYFSKISGQHGNVSTTIVLGEFSRNIDKDVLIRRKEELVVNTIKGKISAVNGATEFIKELKQENYILGLASSTSFVGVNAILTDIGIKKYFSAIHSGESIENGKPHPDIYIKTARMLHTEPKDCVAIEDSSSGVLAAKKAGMKVIGILNGRNSREKLEYADKIVETFKEITPQLMEQL